MIKEVNGHKVYLVDNAIQSVFPPTPKGFWNEMLPDIKVESALILGLGAGTLAKLLLDKYGLIEITGVDNTQTMIQEAVNNLKPVRINTALADAFNYIQKIKGKWDFIGVDLYDGTNFPIKVLHQEFIQDVQNHLTEGGVAVFNIPNLEKLIKANAPKSSRKEFNLNLILSIKSAIIQGN